MKVRLNKFIAQSGYCSRRKADELIKEGKVKVNGQKVSQLGLKIDPEKDLVEVEGSAIKSENKKIYIKIYKPVGYLTQLGRDRFRRKTLTDLFKETGIKERLFPAGRLDYNSEGLLVLTNDGDFANLLMHPRKKIPKKYIVEVEGRVNSKTFIKMKKGKRLKDTYLKPDEINIIKKKKNSTVLEITIHSGQKRVIRRFMDAFQHPVKKLIRIEVGKITAENMKPKEWKKISQSEIEKTVKMATNK